MRELDVIEEIGKFPPIFSYYKNPFECIYYHDVESVDSLKIYVKCDGSCIAQFLYLFELVREASGFFTLKTFYGNEADANIAKIEREEAVNLVTKRILAKTFVDACWIETYPEQKEEYLSDRKKLIEILEKLIGDFIG